MVKIIRTEIIEAAQTKLTGVDKRTNNESMVAVSWTA